MLARKIALSFCLPSLAGTLILIFAAPPRLPVADTVFFLVFPFENLCKSPDLAWVGKGLALSMAEELRVPGVEVLGYEDWVNLVEGADLPPNAPLSRASMIYVAQQASADRLVMGSYSGTVQDLRIALHVLDLKSMKLGGEISANGPLAALPQMENELAWIVLGDGGLNKDYSREKFKERARAVPNSAYSYYVRSLDLPDEEEQIKMLLKAVEIHSNVPDARYRIGRYYFDSGEYGKAIQNLEMALQQRQAYLEVLFMLGTCYLKQEQFAEAIKAYTPILSFKQSVEVLNNLAIAYLRTGDFPLASQNLVQARSLARADPTVTANLALLWHLEGNQQAARAVLEENLRIRPGGGIAAYLLALILTSQGDSEAAAAAMAQAKRLGIDTEKLRSEDPKSWAGIIHRWGHRP